jgi:hypothetical protein
MLRAIERRMTQINAPFDAKHNHCRCLAHIINLAAKDAIGTIQPAKRTAGRSAEAISVESEEEPDVDTESDEDSAIASDSDEDANANSVSHF